MAEFSFYSVLRPRDLLVLKFRFKNFAVIPAAGGQPPKLAKVGGPGQLAAIAVDFPPQHILEQAFFEASGPLAFEFTTQAKTVKPLVEVPTWAVQQVAIPDFARAVAGQCGLTIAGDLSHVSVGHYVLGPLGSPTGFEWWQIGNAMYWLLTPFPEPYDETAVLKLQVLPANEEPDYGQRAQARLSGPSRLVFTVKPGELEEPFEFSLPALLDKLRFREPAVHDPLVDGISAPGEWDTRIEAPFHLVLSPSRDGRWEHFGEIPYANSGLAELWHTRLCPNVLQVPNGPTHVRDGVQEVRAIWALDAVSQGLLANGSVAPNTPVQHDLLPFRAWQRIPPASCRSRCWPGG
jgi:hypothetical protein